jgi:hypothetical protein
VAEKVEKPRRPRRFRPYPEYQDSGVEWLGEISAAVTGKIDVREAVPR